MSTLPYDLKLSHLFWTPHSWILYRSFSPSVRLLELLTPSGCLPGFLENPNRSSNVRSPVHTERVQAFLCWERTHSRAGEELSDVSLTEASESRNERKFSSRFIMQVWFFYVIVAVLISPVTHVLIIWGEELQLSKKSWKYRRAVLLKTLCQTGIKAA